MKELHGKRAAVPPHRTRDIGQSLELRVVPKAWEAQRGVNRVLVDQVPAENDHSQAGLGAFFVVGDRLFGENPFVRAPDPGRANRGEDDAIWQCRVPDTQWREQMAIRADVRHNRFPLRAIMTR